MLFICGFAHKPHTVCLPDIARSATNAPSQELSSVPGYDMMTCTRHTLALLLMSLLSPLMGCGGETQGEDAEDSVVVCGPNEVIHDGPDVEPYCRCADGYEFHLKEGCLPEQAESPEVINDPSDMQADREQEDLPRSLPLSCWLPPGSYCDPRSAASCDTAAGETCDVVRSEGALRVACLSGPNTQTLGQSCDPASGSYCAKELHCVEEGVCRRFCCDSSECGEGMFCRPLSTQLGSLGVCEQGEAPEPQCAEPGAFCAQATDCCSGYCHVGHCH